MNTEDKIKVMQAFLEGETIEVMGQDGWEEWCFHTEPQWNWEHCDYRVKEEDYSLDIPWDLIKDKWKWAAMDDDGEIFLYTKKPEPLHCAWNCPRGDYSDYLLKISKPDAKYWRRTLTERPKGV